MIDRLTTSTYSFLIKNDILNNQETGRSLVCSQNQTPCEPVSPYIENILSVYLKTLPRVHPFLTKS